VAAIRESPAKWFKSSVAAERRARSSHCVGFALVTSGLRSGTSGLYLGSAASRYHTNTRRY
jgi:hypothetical protein